MIQLEELRVATQCQMLLRNAKVLMRGEPSDQVEAYSFASMVRGVVEAVQLSLRPDDDCLEQFQQLNVQAIIICNQFEREFGVHAVSEEMEGEPLPPLLVPPPENVKAVVHSQRKRGVGEPLDYHERLYIWDTFNGPNARPKRYRFFSEVAELLHTTETTVSRWANEHPGDGV